LCTAVKVYDVSADSSLPYSLAASDKAYRVCMKWVRSATGTCSQVTGAAFMGIGVRNAEEVSADLKTIKL
jgi:hypothetical protein